MDADAHHALREGGRSADRRGPSALPRRRSALIAIILSGLGPGAGHAYVGRPLRGFVLVAALAATSAAFVLAVPVSYESARLFAIPPMILVLAVIADAGRLARVQPPGVLRPWQRGWTYAAIVLVTGFLAPAAATAALDARVAVIMAPDAALDPAVLQGDWVIVERAGEAPEFERGDVLAVARASRAPMLRRLVGLPGETAGVVRGVAEVREAALPARLARPLFAEDLTLAPVRLGASELLVLGDRRERAEAPEARVSASDVLGRASWILFPADGDILRIGAKP